MPRLGRERDKAGCSPNTAGSRERRTGALSEVVRAFLLERGIAVRQGLNFLRAEFPAILAKRTDVLSPRMLHIIGSDCFNGPLYLFVAR